MRRHAGRSGDGGEVVARRSSSGAPGRRTLAQGLRPAARRAASPGSAPKPPTTGDVATAAVASKGTGASLGSDVRRKIEPHLGADLSEVRIHGDATARAASAALGARAFTYGADIFLGQGEAADDTRLIAHEATHVVQQG